MVGLRDRSFRFVYDGINRLSTALPLSTIAFCMFTILMIWATREGETNGGILQFDGMYLAWLYLVVTAPVLMALSWVMLTRLNGLLRYWGHWIRIAADMSMLFAVAAFDVIHFSYEQPIHFLVRMSVLSLLTALLTRDAHRLFHIERAAVQIAREQGRLNG